MREGIDTSTPAGRMTAGLFSVIAEFERARIQEGVYAGLARAKAQGKTLGRPIHASAGSIGTLAGRTNADAARKLGVSIATVKRWRREQREGGAESLPADAEVSPPIVQHPSRPTDRSDRLTIE